MNKFIKRISKNIKKSPIDCLVVGDGFSHIDDILEMFNTVFVYSTGLNDRKARNLVLRQNIESTFHLLDLSAIFVDRNKTHVFDKIESLLANPSPDIFVEGNEVLPRTETKM